MRTLRNNQVLIARLCDLLTAPRHFRSCDLIAPPGFDEVGLTSDVINGLRMKRADVLIAECAIDEIADASSFVSRLAESWEVSGLNSYSVPPDQRLQLLFNRLSSDRPAILTLRRFHKLLDTLPAWLLGALRTAEQQGLIRTLVISPVSTQELKQRWLSQGHPLVVSNYGDTHSRHIAGLIHPDDLSELSATFELPKHVTDYAFQTSGGYPELFMAMAHSWHDQGKPQSLSQSVKKQLNRSTEALCNSFCRKLDPDASELIFCHYVANLYEGIETEESIEILRRHEWREILLNNNALTCKHVGECAFNLMIEQTRKKFKGSNRYSIYEKARSLYLGRFYSSVNRLIDGLTEVDKKLDLLLLHAQIMEALCPYQTEFASIDSNWGLIPSLVRRAKRVAADCRILDPDVYEHMCVRYDSLAKYAQLINENRREHRPIDKLSAVVAKDRNKEDLAVCTLLLLHLHAQSARSRSDANEAVQLAMALPEQIFRVWAMWALNLDYYDRPPGSALSDEGKSCFSSPDTQASLVRADQRSTPFPSFKFFFLYCRDQAPAHGFAETFAEWRSDLELMTNFRNDRAHAVTSAQQEHNKKFLELLDRWLAHTHLVAPPLAQRMTWVELREIVQPLPVP